MTGVVRSNRAGFRATGRSPRNFGVTGKCAAMTSQRHGTRVVVVATMRTFLAIKTSVLGGIKYGCGNVVTKCAVKRLIYT